MGVLISSILLEEFIIYGLALGVCILVIVIYLRRQRKISRHYELKIEKAKEEGLFEPLSLHPVIDTKTCIKSGACITACPEKDIIGLVHGRATLVNASNCVGHGACFHACPVEAISLVIGTERRGIDLPHVNQNYESNIPGIYIAGELGGMGLIKNSVEQGKSAVENMIASGFRDIPDCQDLVIIGAGPAGISASLAAKKHKLRFLTLEQESLGGTVFTFPRAKVVMTSPMDLPLYGKVQLRNTSKSELLQLWNTVLQQNQIDIQEQTKVNSIEYKQHYFIIHTDKQEQITTQKVLLAIGRRGTPRKLNVPGEDLEKVAYRLLEPEHISGKEILVVGGGDSAIESALLLMGQNKVRLSYRSDTFSRLKPKNNELIKMAIEQGTIKVHFNSQVLAIEKDRVHLQLDSGKTQEYLANDLVFIFAGGELPTQFLEKAGIQISKRFGYTMMKHK